jgi:hypothetical protein
VSINWTKLLPALLLILFPFALLHGKNVRYRAVVRGWEGYWSRIFLLVWHPIDFLRAAVGAWLLAQAVAVPDAYGLLRYAPYVIHGAVFVTATIIQTLVCKEPDSAQAPFAFLIGLVLGYLPALLPGYAPLLTAAVAVLLAAVLARGLNAPAVFFPVLALAVVVLGVVFAQKKLLLPLAAIAPALGLPWLLTLLFPRDLIVPYLAKPSAAPAVKP